MDNTYVIIKNNIKEAYDDVDTFSTKIINFKTVNPSLEYDLQIIKDKNDKWNVIARIWDDEKDKEILHTTNVDILEES